MARVKGVTFKGCADLPEPEEEQREELDEKSREIEQERRATLQGWMIVASRANRRKMKYADKVSAKEKRSNKVRNMTLTDYKKEGGVIMAKTLPYSITAKNVIYYMRSQGPLTTAEIAEIIGKEPKQISSVVSYLKGSQIAVATPIAVGVKGFRYQIISQKSVDDLYWEMLDYQRKCKKQHPSAVRRSMPKKRVAPHPDDINTEAEKPPLVYTEEEKAKMRRAVSGADAVKVSPGLLEDTAREFGLNVRVEGSIKILFGFAKEDK